MTPKPAVNSWAPYSGVWVETDPDQLKVMVEDPVVVTLPNQTSMSPPNDVPANATPLVQVVTPPPVTEDSVRVVTPTWA